MCGIAGIFYLDSEMQVDKMRLKQMTDIIAHRGPDAEGQFIKRNVGLGHRRLSIIDLSEDGHQPMCNEDGSVWIVFNGEFFNYLDFKDEIIQKGHTLKSKSDTEYIIHLYEEYGFDVVNKINGMFSFVIYDFNKDILFAARDRLGVKPFNYLLDDDKFLFGSEIKSILAYGGINRQIDKTAVSDYFSFMSIPAPKSIYQNIRKLEPGHTLIIQNKVVKINKYWDLNYNVENKPDSYYYEKFIELFEDSTKLRLISDVPLGAFLSGGVDSSAVVAMMAKAKSLDIKTFSITFKEQKQFDESKYARQVAEQYQTLHTEFNLSSNFIDVLPKLIWHFDEPFAVSSAFALYYLSKLTREHVTVALSGDGGDELFAGYPFRYSHDQRYDTLEKIPMPLRKFLVWGTSTMAMAGDSKLAAFTRKFRDFSAMAALPRDEAFMKDFSYFDAKAKASLFKSDFYQEIRNYDSNDVFKKYYQSNVRGSQLFKRQLGDIKTTLPDEMLKKVDSMTMAVALEARTPFLDYRMVEFSASVPDHLKLNNRNGKAIVKKSMEKYLSHDILYRKKHGFNVPFGEWAKNELYDYLVEVFSKQEMQYSEIFDYKKIQQLLKWHRSGKHNFSNQIYLLLVFELWRKGQMI